mmetsp:Transcript_8357/g.18239  ORF Transcript_8357/g.18239 Transcript_8357/m.18239 type:complete len:227 (+) Transcript_8357:1266-1946(+)
MLKNFSMPMSAPKPASVMTKPSGPASLSATWSATMEEFPVAMLAKGPAWTMTGVDSAVCMRVGMMASFMSTVMAPPAPRSSAVMGAPFLEYPTTIAPSFSRISLRLVASASTAMTSEATVMSNPVARLCCFLAPFTPMVSGTVSFFPRPTSTFRRCRSQVSMTRCHVTVSGSMSSLTNLEISSSVSSFGSVFSTPSFRSRRNITGANPFFSGHSRRKSAASDWADS